MAAGQFVSAEAPGASAATVPAARAAAAPSATSLRRAEGPVDLLDLPADLLDLEDRT
ncbi:hypothetical protein Scel_38820 [Streptomyces cellostaticus]|nr:hypothetical protein Scel_38820 [Streptomyces cellostaticus]